MIKLSTDTRVKLLQATAYIGFLYTLIFQFDLHWLLPSLVFSWLIFLLGASLGLHKYSSHRAFETKNDFYKVVMLFASTVLCLGSNISWASTHRKHHQYSDRPEDPHSPNVNPSLWRSIKLWFYYFPTYHVSPSIVKDLTVDPIHKFFHRNYFKINIIYVVVLALIDIRLACYFYFVPVIYTFTAISYITVLAHNPWLSKFGYKNIDSRDLSFNSRVASVFVPGDGNHNNHHGRPGMASNKIADRDWDLGFWLVKLIGRLPKTQITY
jgi:stearoyl-CoA desaturase (delta-9 desaturase)